MKQQNESKYFFIYGVVILYLYLGIVLGSIFPMSLEGLLMSSAFLMIVWLIEILNYEKKK